MNRRALALVGAAVVLIAGGTWLLLASEVEAPTPVIEAQVPPAPPALPIAHEPVAAVIALPRAEAVDAGVLAEVEIEVVEGGKQMIGVRVELEGPSGRVGRPTDVMGYARFTLEPGAWRITSPRRRLTRATAVDGGRDTFSTPLEVRAPLTRFRLELPVIHLVRGRVIDLQGAPVPGATVKWAPAEFVGVDETLSDTFGQFTLKTLAEKVLVEARLGQSRSIRRSLGVEGNITLTLEPWTPLQVDVTGGGAEVARVRVFRNDEQVAEGLSTERLWVPMGELKVRARRKWRASIYSGMTSIVLKPQMVAITEVALSPSPPLRGRVVNAAGLPVPGLSLEVRELERREEGTEVVVVDILHGLTGHQGEFSIVPSVSRSVDPVYLLSVAGLWRTTRQVLVRIDDAPLEVAVEPVP